MGGADRLEFRLLGPVEVCRGAQQLAMSSRHQRSVLAALALRPGRVVSVDALVDVVWEDEPPPSARRQVIKLVSRLRAMLGATITTGSSGYLLNAEPDQVDIGVFDSAVAGARKLSATDPPGAARAVREALRLWRGPALSGVTPGLAAQATRLEETRLSALEDGVDWELAAGGHAALVAELTMVVSEHPLRERLVGQLMLALHRSGRTTEALEVYQRTHDRGRSDSRPSWTPPLSVGSGGQRRGARVPAVPVPAGGGQVVVGADLFGRIELEALGCTG